MPPHAIDPLHLSPPTWHCQHPWAMNECPWWTMNTNMTLRDLNAYPGLISVAPNTSCAHLEPALIHRSPVSQLQHVCSIALWLIVTCKNWHCDLWRSPVNSLRRPICWGLQVAQESIRQNHAKAAICFISAEKQWWQQFSKGLHQHCFYLQIHFLPRWWTKGGNTAGTRQGTDIFF